MDGSLFLGFDGGQSKSLAVLVDSVGHVIERTTGPSFDHLRAIGGIDKIRLAFQACLNVPSIQSASVKSAFFGLTGLWSPDSPESSELREILKDFFNADLIVLDNDSVSCWAGALGGEPGVVVAAGTGVVSYGLKEQDVYAKLGGWGHVMGDLGGAYDIGRKALQLVTTAEDLGNRDNCLKHAILNHFGLPDLRSLQAFLYAREDRVQLVAQCSELVSSCAQTGDPMSLEILRDAGCNLGQLAVRTARVLGWSKDDAVKFSMAGGVFSAGPALIESFTETIYRVYPKAVVKKPMFEPVIGAVLIAWSQAGLDANSAYRLTNLRNEWRKLNEG